MKLFAGIGLIGIAGAGVYFFASPRPADEFPMPMSQAYEKLSSVKLVPSPKDGLFHGLAPKVSGNGRDKVTWEGTGSMAHRECDLTLAPVADKPDQTHVTVTCKGGGAGEGAASGMMHNMVRNRVIEMVDATLTGRAFNPAIAGATASRWPGDGVDGSMSTAAGNALKMERDIHNMRADAERFRAQEMAQAARDAEDREEAAVQREEREKAAGNFN